MGGTVSAALMSQGGIMKMYSGATVEADCEGLQPGSTPYCPANADGALDVNRDCKLFKVDEAGILFSLSIAVPVRREVQHALSWAHVKQLEQGTFKTVKSTYASQLPTPMKGCPNTGLSESEPMPIS